MRTITLVLTSARTMASPWTRSRARLGGLSEKASSKKLRLLLCLVSASRGCGVLARRAMSPGGARSMCRMRWFPSIRGGGD